MPQVLRPEFHSNLASQLVKEIQYLKSNFYYFLGKVSPWNVTDAAPATIPVTLASDKEARENMLYLGKIKPNDTSIVTARYDWVSGTVYTRWDDSVDMRGSAFYVKNGGNRIYKCLDNYGGAPSTIEPSAGDGMHAFRLADGYVWKYMYTIPEFKQFKFINQNFIPVQTSLSDSFYNRGAISDVSIGNGGSGYVGNSTSITVFGDGTGAQFTPVVSGGSVVDVIIDNPGSNYSYAILTVVGVGTGAVMNGIIGLNDVVSDQSTVEQIAVPGGLYAARITEPGSGYDPLVTPTITITGDGVGATAVAVMDAGELVRVDMLTFGSGYSYAVFNIEAPSGIGTVAAEIQPIYGPLRGHGNNAVNELMSDTVCISTVLNANPTISDINQDYRQYGIIKNPATISNGAYATVSEALVVYKVSLLSTVGMTVDMELTSTSNYKYIVVKFDATSAYLQPLSNTVVSPLGALSAEGGASFFASALISSPAINKYSGEIMTVSAESPFSFTAQQSVALKTYIKC